MERHSTPAQARLTTRPGRRRDDARELPLVCMRPWIRRRRTTGWRPSPAVNARVRRARNADREEAGAGRAASHPPAPRGAISPLPQRRYACVPSGFLVSLERLADAMNFFRNVAGVLLTSVVNIPVAFATGVVLARFLDVEERGVYSVATTFAFTAMVLTQLGWGNAAIYRLRRERSHSAQVVGAGVLVVALVSLLSIGALFAFGDLIRSRFLDGATLQVLLLTLALIPLQLLANFFGSVARGIDRFRFENWFSFLLNVGTLAAVTFAVVLRDGGVVETLVAVLVVRAVATTGLIAAVLGQTGLSFAFDWSEIRESARFGAKSYVQTLAGRLHERVDIFMLAYLLGDPAQIAFYTIAAGLVRHLKLVPVTLSRAAYPQIAGLPEERASEFTCSVLRISTIWVVFAVLALAAVASRLVPLIFGAEYANSVPAFLVLLPGVATLTSYRVLARYFTALDRQQAAIATQAFSVALNVGLNMALIPRYGIVGAALASLASYTTEAVLIVAVFRWYSGRRLGELFLPRRSDWLLIRRRLEPFVGRLRLARPRGKRALGEATLSDRLEEESREPLDP